MNDSFVHFLGIEIQATTPQQAVEMVLSSESTSGRAFHLANSFTMVLASEEPALREVLCADLVFCDGVPLARALMRKNSKMQSVRGPSLMKNVLAQSGPKNTHFFLGGSPVTIDKLVSNVTEAYTNAAIVGTHSPEYSNTWSDKIDAWVDMISESRATIVWIGLGTPKQDYVVHEIASRLNVTVMAVGAAFDFIAGTQPEAPKFLQGSGFEWVYRLLKEPKRLWRRYLIGNVQFIWLVIKESKR